MPSWSAPSTSAARPVAAASESITLSVQRVPGEKGPELRWDMLTTCARTHSASPGASSSSSCRPTQMCTSRPAGNVGE